jgi:hypothetical protein
MTSYLVDDVFFEALAAEPFFEDALRDESNMH